MIISSQGFGHYTDGINNQDLGIEHGKMLLLLDGCTAAKYSDSGVRLFGQLFSRKGDCDNLEKFEDNVKSVFDDIIRLSARYYATREELEKDFIMENLLFTIIACFETEDKYVVKLFGDGYIVTQNVKGLISYIKFAYGKCPPYCAYRYCQTAPINFQTNDFKTFIFDKKSFSKVLIASDGLMHIAKGAFRDLDTGIATGNFSLLETLIREQRMRFFDDVTILTFGGKN